MFHIIIEYLNRFLTIFGLRKEQMYWGVVYDSITKQPIDPAIVKLIHVDSGHTVETCITDLEGHYGFLAYPGRFKLFVQRTNYKFPSELQAGFTDGVYENLYHGEFFELAGDSDVVALNIPLDPIKFDWNQQAKETVVRTNPHLEHLVNTLLRIVFWLGFVLAGAWYYLHRSHWLWYVLGAYGFVFLLALATPKVRLWGRVKEKQTGQPLPNILVQICHPELPDMVIAKATTSEEGKFFLRANRGRYLLKVVEQTDQGKVERLSRIVRVGPSGVVSEDISI